MALRHRLANNPLPWLVHDGIYDASIERLRPALAALRSIGFDALHAEIPDGMTPADYRSLLEDNGLAPAPGYFRGDFWNADDHGGLFEAIRVHAAAHAALGLTETFVAEGRSVERRARPAVGADASDDRLQIITDALVASAELSVAEGVVLALHPHVGTWIETEAEVRAVLDATAGSALQFGPDVGHLAWAGMDSTQLIADYRDRVVAVHLKDVDPAAIEYARTGELDYRAATTVAHVWTEPGRGQIDFDAVLDELGSDFNGWCVVEVDVPNLPTADDSARASFDYLTARPFFRSRLD